MPRRGGGMSTLGGAAGRRKGQRYRACFALAAAVPVLLPATGLAASSGIIDLMGAYQKAIDQSPGFQAGQAQYRAGREAGPQALAKVLPQLGAQGSASYVK